MVLIVGSYLFVTTSKIKIHIMLWVFILLPREGLFVINFMPFIQQLGMVFVCYEK